MSEIVRHLVDVLLSRILLLIAKNAQIIKKRQVIVLAESFQTQNRILYQGNIKLNVISIKDSDLMIR